MKNYVIRIRAEVPYPKDFDYRIEANSTGRALDFAYRQFRKEPQVKGRREKCIACLALPIGELAEGTEHLSEEEIAEIAMGTLTRNAK